MTILRENPVFNKFFIKPLEFKIGEQTLRFNSASDFAFSMDGRTAVSSTKLSELFKLSTEQLETQAETITKINISLYSILTRAVEEPDSINRLLRELDPLTFSQDHSWRDIIHALNENNEEFNSIRTTVLTKYTKYLTSLEDTIGYICSDRKQSIGAQVDDDEKEKRKFGATWTPDQIRSELEVDSQTEDEFKRLPKDKKVSVKLLPGERLDIRLASHKCQLVATDDYVQFIDNTGGTTLSKGRNIVGRGAECTVKVDDIQKRVSRTHLHILINDNHTLQLIDHSSAGTSITSEFLK
jgi:hypothetical protein